MRKITLLAAALLIQFACGNKKADPEATTSEAYQELQRQVVQRETSEGLVLVEIDLNSDSKPDVFNYYRERSNAARLLVRKELDMNLDGRIDIISHFDDTGALVREEMDGDFDGQFDWTDHYQNAKRVMSEADTNYDGKLDVFTYYDNGKPTRKERDTDGDGRIDFWERFDESGNVIKTGADTTCDGKMDVREE